MPTPPPTAYKPGTQLVVGSHDAEIVKFIGEGGFAHVYTVKVTPPIPGHDLCCLKRVQVPNKAYLNILRAEVGAMQRLKGCSNVVQYIDSHAERMHQSDAQGQYEVFLLMEFCEGGGLIEFMNSRLRDMLREHEILKIMYDITLGLAHMHYLQPPLLHRDLKIENVLITGDGTFKLCDFGSVSPVLRPPKTPQEFKILDDDIQHHTTVQYRSPEMLDITQNHPIDEKSDIWALGIFLYKLCFYTTPFEFQGQTYEQFKQLVLGGVFNIPQRPAYSERLKNMIRVLLQTDPRLRPNVYQVMQEICSMRHVECPLMDIYQIQRPVRPQPQVQPLQLPVQVSAVPGVAQASSQAPSQAPSQTVSQVSSSGSLAGLVPQMQLPNISVSQIPNMGNMPNMPQVSQASQIPGSGSTQQIPSQYSLHAHYPAVLTISPVESPLQQPVSPGADDIALRYPSLEDLDKISPLISLDSAKVLTPARPKPEASSISRSKSDAGIRRTRPAQDYPMPQRPHPSSKQETKVPENLENKATVQPSARPPIQANQANQSMPADANISELSDSEEDGESDENTTRLLDTQNDQLKKILTGISNRTSTVVLDDEDGSRNLSSVEFLKALDTGGGGHKRSKSRSVARKPSYSRYYNKYSQGEADLGSSDDEEVLAMQKNFDADAHSSSAPTSPRLKPTKPAKPSKLTKPTKPSNPLKPLKPLKPVKPPRPSSETSSKPALVDINDSTHESGHGDRYANIRRKSSDASRFDIQHELEFDTRLGKKPKPKLKSSSKPRRSSGGGDYDYLEYSDDDAYKESSEYKQYTDYSYLKDDLKEHKHKKTQSKTKLTSMPPPKPAKPASLKPTLSFTKDSIEAKDQSSRFNTDALAAAAAKKPVPIHQPKPVRPSASTSTKVDTYYSSSTRFAKPDYIAPKPRFIPERPKSAILMSKEQHIHPYDRVLRTRLTGSDDESMHGSTHGVDGDSETVSLASDETLSANSTGDFRPSNSVQQRVYHFLNLQNRQRPPRRTATGYGRYTDEYEQSDRDNHDELDDRSDEMRSRVNTLRL